VSEAARILAASRALRRQPGRAGVLALGPAATSVAVIAMATVARLVAGASIGLSVDESYAVSVSRTLSLSYVDHPPLSFWLPGIVARVTGSEAGLVLRLPFIALFAGTSWLLFRLTRRLFGERAGLFAVLLLSVSPVFSFSSGGWVLPDGPLMFFMLAAALCLERVLVSGDVQHAWRWWLGAGGCTGLALLSKYHGVFLLAGTVLFLATRADARFWLRKPHPWVATALALAIFAPALVWNAQHAWVSIRFQGGRGVPTGGIHPIDLLRSLGGQALYLLPWIWIPAAWLLARGLAAGPRNAAPNDEAGGAGPAIADGGRKVGRETRGRWLLVCLAIGPILFFTLPALGGRPGLPHWEAPGWLFTFPLLGAAADEWLVLRPRAARAWLAACVAGYALIWGVGLSQMATGWMAHAWSRFPRGDPSWEVVDWSALAPALAAHQLPARGDFVAARRWMDAGKVAYALGPGVPVTCLCENPHHFAFSAPQERFLGRDAVIVLPPDPHPGDLAALRPHFASLQRLDAVVVRRHGRPEFVLVLYLGRRFTTPVETNLVY
jgi:hypothetical protein